MRTESREVLSVNAELARTATRGLHRRTLSSAPTVAAPRRERVVSVGAGAPIW